MKTQIKNPFLLPMLLAALGLLLAGRAPAQTFTVMHTFAASHTNSSGSFTNSDGALPQAGLTLSGNTLYGTAANGGSGANGTVFKVNTDGTGFTNLYVFSASPPPNYTNSDGGYPYAGLVLSGNTLYGAADIYGAHGSGTVFAISTNGTSFTNLYSFTAHGSYPSYTNSDGINPSVGLLLSGNTLYGVAYNEGIFGGGTVYRVNINGTSFTNLHSFAAISYYPNNTNKDGGNPSSVLVLSGNTLYGTTGMGGTNGNGTVFKVNTDGTGFTNLHIFSANAASPYTNSDGTLPQAGLILSGNTLYGVAGRGGNGNSGTVFSLNTNGTGFTTLHSFAASPGYNAQGSSTNSDGSFPDASLLLSGNTLYGTTCGGGGSGNGTVFAINTNGTGFQNLYFFTALSTNYYTGGTNSDGALPESSLILSGNILYGTAAYGGRSGNGTIFSINLALNIKTNGLAASQLSGGIAQLTYLGTPGAKFALDWAHLFATPTTWTPLATNTTTPNGYLIFTNTASGSNDFYRIRSVP
jgi:uncharacterized repeat protein (TIGR03803 family)